MGLITSLLTRVIDGMPQKLVLRCSGCLVPLLVFSACGQSDNGLETSDRDSKEAIVENSPSSEQSPSKSDSITVQGINYDDRPEVAEIPTFQSSFDRNGDGWMTWDEVSAGVESQFSAFSWPQNYQTTPNLLLSKAKSMSEVGEGESGYQASTDYAILADANMCAWYFSWKDAFKAADNAEIERSLGQIRAIALSAPHLILVRDQLEARLNSAALGDPAPLHEMLDSFCDPTLFAALQPSAPPMNRTGTQFSTSLFEDRFRTSANTQSV